MRFAYLLFPIVASLIVVSPVLAFDVCLLVSRTEMTGVIGEDISSMTPSGPKLDPDTGAQTWNCVY